MASESTQITNKRKVEPIAIITLQSQPVQGLISVVPHKIFVLLRCALQMRRPQPRCTQDMSP